jgi:peptidylprolyl isomerase
VQVHYVKRFEDGSVTSSRDHAPLGLTVGAEHPRLPGLGLALVGLAEGESTRLRVPAERAHGLYSPARVRRLSRARFLAMRPVPAGAWVRLVGRRGRRYLVRVLQQGENEVLIDANHRRAGQAVELEVEVVAIHGPGTGPEARAHTAEPRGPRAVAFDVDAASLASLREAFPGWQVEAVSGATRGSLERDWAPGTAELLVVGARDSVAETLGLCREVRSQVGRAHTPLLVLVRPAQESLVAAALRAGADSCLVLPLQVRELERVVERARKGDQPGRHASRLDRSRAADIWRDEGGQG